MIFLHGHPVRRRRSLAAPLLVEVTNFGFHNVPGKFELAVQLTRILFPFILFVSLAAAVMGMLNARFVFGVPASASTVFNIVSVIAGVGLAYAFDPARAGHLAASAFHRSARSTASAWACCSAASPSSACSFRRCYRLGFRFHWRLNLEDPRLAASCGALMWPSVIAGAAVQVNVLVNGNFASEINGGRSWLFCAFRLMQFPYRPLRRIAGHGHPAGRNPRLRPAATCAPSARTAKDSLRLAWFLALPAAAGLAVLARPIIALIYQHGRFSAHDTHQTAHGLAGLRHRLWPAMRRSRC